MKKSLVVLALVGCMIMSLSAATMASSAYLSGIASGSWENNIKGTDDDQDLGFVIGGEYNFLDKYKVGLEYLSGTEEKADNGSDLDYESFELKFGYRVIQNKQFNMDVTLAYYDESYDDAADTEIDGAILGADLNYIFNDKFSLSGSLGFSVDGSVDAGSKLYDGNDADILMAKIQGNYNFTDQWAGSLGYRYISSDIDNADDLSNDGITLGVRYSF